MPLLTAYERTQQIQGRALAFFDNNAALSDPRGYTIKKASTSHSPLIDTILGKTVNNLGVSVQAALAVTNPSRYGIVFNTSLYPVVAAMIAVFIDVWLNKLAVVTTLGSGGPVVNRHGAAVLSNGDIVIGGNNFQNVYLISMPGGAQTTLAGNGAAGFADGTGTSAQFSNPSGVAVLPNGNIVVADKSNHRIRLITMPGVVVTTLAGNGNIGFADGTGASTQFSSPIGVAVLPNGNIIVSDTGNNRVRLITMPDGVVSTLATGLNDPWGAAAVSNDLVAVAERSGRKIKLVTVPGGVVTILAGSGSFASTNGTGTAASFAEPRDITVLPNGNLVVADSWANLIRLVTLAGVVTTLAGSGASSSTNGTGEAAGIYAPEGLCVLPNGTIVIVEYNNSKLRLITPT